MTGNDPVTKADLKATERKVAGAILLCTGGALGGIGVTFEALLLLLFGLAFMSIGYAVAFDGYNRSMWNRIPGLSLDDSDDLEVPA